MQNKVEVEFRVNISIKDFENIVNRISNIATLKNRKKRFSVMLFIENNDDLSILYLRTTVDSDNNSKHTEIVHKKGKQHVSDRIEISKEIPSSQFEEYIKILGTLSTSKSLVMQRETVNFIANNDITISLVKAHKHAYVEFEILCEKDKKESQQKRLIKFLETLNMSPMNEEESMSFFDTLDKEDDRIISGTMKDVESVIEEYNEFIG